MMPKGVEHDEGPRAWEARRWVKIPMMPKGVEHTTPGGQSGSGRGVKIPMMPKGVEHLKVCAATRFNFP